MVSNLAENVLMLVANLETSRPWPSYQGQFHALDYDI